MRVLFEFVCNDCGEKQERLVMRGEVPQCLKCNGTTKKLIATPAFTFANGKGTDGGSTMRIPGCKVPG